MVSVNNPIIISSLFYFVIVLVIFLSNLGNKFAKEKQVLFYYIISVIIVCTICSVITST